jgi:hypothetical protein
MSAAMLVPQAASMAAAAPANNVVYPNPITQTLSNGVGDINAISAQEADAILNAAKSGSVAGRGGGRLIPF